MKTSHLSPASETQCTGLEEEEDASSETNNRETGSDPQKSREELSSTQSGDRGGLGWLELCKS
jgi:hypothetical protein